MAHTEAAMAEDYWSDPKFVRFVHHQLRKQRDRWASEAADAWQASIEQAKAKRPDTVIFYQAGSDCAYLLHVPHSPKDYAAEMFGDDED
jgi:hypothetical protein